MSAFKCFFSDLRVLVRKLASPFGHPTQVSTQVQLAATCDSLRIRLARALNLHFRVNSLFHHLEIQCLETRTTIFGRIESAPVLLQLLLVCFDNGEG